MVRLLLILLEFLILQFKEYHKNSNEELEKLAESSNFPLWQFTKAVEKWDVVKNISEENLREDKENREAFFSCLKIFELGRLVSILENWFKSMRCNLEIYTNEYVRNRMMDATIP